MQSKHQKLLLVTTFDDNILLICNAWRKTKFGPILITIHVNALVTIRALIHIRCQLRQAELTTLIMLMKIRQFCPKSGELERVSHKIFLSYVISCHSQATSESKELDSRGKPRWSREAETLVIKSAASKRHKTPWPLKTVLCSLVPKKSWGSREPHTVRGPRVPPAASGQLLEIL